MASSMFLICLLSLAFPPSLHVTASMDLIQKTCKSTKYYDLCVSSLKSDPTSPNASTKGLAIIMVGIGRANATATSSYLSSQLLTTANDTTLKAVLKECADKYAYAANALQSAAQDLAMEESFDTASIHIMAAADYPNACRNGFRRFKGLAYPSEIGQRQEGLKRICDVVLGIIDFIGF